MGKNTKILIFSLIGLVLLGGITALLLLTAPSQEQKAPAGGTASAAVTQQTDTVDLRLCSRGGSEVVSIDVENASGKYRISNSGKKTEEDKIIWSVSGLAEERVDQDAVSSVIGYVSSVKGNQFAETVSDPSGLEKYGLSAPAAKIKTTFTDGDTFSYKIGNAVPNSPSEVYMTADDKNVFTIDSYRTEVFTESVYSFVPLDAVPALDSSAGEQVGKLTVERTDLEEPIIIESIEPAEGDKVRVYSYRMTSPYSSYLDLTDGGAFVQSIFGLSAQSAYGSALSEKDLKASGLDSPVCTVTAQTGSKTYSLRLGSEIFETEKTDDGTELRRSAGIYGISSEVPDIIFIFSKENIPAFTKKPSELLSRLFLLPYIFSLDSIDYSSSDGAEYSFAIEHTAATDTEKEINKVSVNGEACDWDRFKELYQFFISASGDELYLDDDKGELLAAITYNYKDNSDGENGKDTIRFYSSNTDRMVIINLNGRNIFKTRPLYLTQLSKNVASFFSGSEIVQTY